MKVPTHIQLILGIYPKNGGENTECACMRKHARTMLLKEERSAALSGNVLPKLDVRAQIVVFKLADGTS